MERAYVDEEEEGADALEKERMEAEYGESGCIGGEGQRGARQRAERGGVMRSSKRIIN